MSVLVEAISILIPKHALDEKFPGGAEGYLRLARRAPGARWALADERVTCVSFESLDDGQRFVEPLRQAGFDGSPDPIAFVDQYFGPTAVCRWLRWRRNDEGFTSCWLEGAEAGELVAPSGWSSGNRAQSADAAHAAVAEEPPVEQNKSFNFSFDASLLPEEFEEIDVDAQVIEEFGEDGPEDVDRSTVSPEAESESAFDAEFDVGSFSETTAAAPSPGFSLALDEVPPPLPSDGWDPTEPVRDDASELAEDLPRLAGDGLFEPLQLGAALESALSAAPLAGEAPYSTESEGLTTAEPAPTESAFNEPEPPEQDDEQLDFEPPAAIAVSDAPEAPILTFRPPVGDGWDEEEERTAHVQPLEQAPSVIETPAWGSAPQMATEEEDWWEGDVDSEAPAVREAQFTEHAAQPLDEAEDEEPDEPSAAEETAPAAADAEEEAQLVYGAWLPDLPSSAGGAQPTPSSGTALLEAEEEEAEDYGGYHESYASVAEGIVPAFAVPDSVVERRVTAPVSSAGEPSDIAQSARDLAGALLVRKGWMLSEDDEGALLFQVRGSRARFQGTVSLERGADTLRIHTHLPTSVPAASRASVAEFLLRTAPRLALGAFELDYESGEIRCRVNVDLGDAPLTETRLERLLDEGVAACDQYHDAVMQLVYAGRSVAEALADLDAGR